MADKSRAAIRKQLAEEGYNERERKRLLRNQKARERHWRKTGVGDRTINWMRRNAWL